MKFGNVSTLIATFMLSMTANGTHAEPAGFKGIVDAIGSGPFELVIFALFILIFGYIAIRSYGESARQRRFRRLSKL